MCRCVEGFSGEYCEESKFTLGIDYDCIVIEL